MLCKAGEGEGIREFSYAYKIMHVKPDKVSTEGWLFYKMFSVVHPAKEGGTPFLLDENVQGEFPPERVIGDKKWKMWYKE